MQTGLKLIMAIVLVVTSAAFSGCGKATSENASAPPTKTEPAMDEAKAKQHRMDVNGVTAFAEIQAISDQIKGKYHPDPTQALGKGTTYPTLTADEIDSIYIKAYRAKYYGK